MSQLNPYHAQMITRLYRAMVGYRGTYTVAADFIASSEEDKIKFYADNVLPKLKELNFPETHTEAAYSAIEAVVQEMIHSA